MRSRTPVRAKTRRGGARVTKPSAAKLSPAQQAYEAIKLRIISLEYRPGACLTESRIAEDLGLGRMPIHDAITRLALEDMLEVLPRRESSYLPYHSTKHLPILRLASSMNL